MIQIEVGATDTGLPMILWRNVLAEGALVASSEAPDGFAENALGPQTFDYWTPTAVPATLAVTLAAAEACDACAIFGHTLGSAGATIEVQYDSGSGWTTVATATPTTNEALLFIFPSVTAAQWRIRITGAVASISIAMIGKRLVVPTGVQTGYVTLDMALRVEMIASQSVTGQFFASRVNRKGAMTSIALATQRRTWIEGDASSFITHFNEGRTFAWASAPELLTRDLGYCRRAGGVLAATYDAGAIYGELSMEIDAYVG